MNTPEIIPQRIAQLRLQMKKAGVQACYFSGTDPHQSEYMPTHWQARSYISGFTGSAGLVVVTHEKAALWTDSRYFLQAGQQLQNTGIELMKQRVTGTPEPAEWLNNSLKEGDTVGTDFACLSVLQYNQLSKALAAGGLTLKDTSDLLSADWEERPPLPNNPIFEHDLQYAGTKRTDKISAILNFVKTNGANATLITALDDLAWTFNLRGTDVDFNPVFVGFAFLSEKEKVLFVDSKKMDSELAAKLQEDQIQLKAYTEFYSFLSQLSPETIIMIDSARTNQASIAAIPPTIQLVEQTSAPTLLKAQKSTFEIIHLRETMKKDGAAMVKLLHWLNQNVGQTNLTEYDVVEKLEYFRAQQDGFQGNSFYPIVGLNANGAIVHRSVSKETAAEINQDGMLLFDSGGQYLGGTTDITRTIALSSPSAQQKRDFTLVLKGMIGLSMAQFPAGALGSNLDAYARMHLWKNGLNYGHGTGHGIGYFLNVHEGPMSIRQEYNEQTIKPGMVLSNEPGLYREGEYGIRIENVIVCTEKEETPFGRFLAFETLTLCPIDLKLIDTQLMTKEEIDWLNQYHQKVYKKLAPLLEADELEFLKQQTQEIH
ncbi:aminopeptidase P family protein [uncultured Sunxiuqinia sp.]|uniref:aminopeptidase P family protein n=1 Tax=uncultured Sunxiuqinia sp. TaxID=1573825 RepID=UPI002609EB09|nr:aminopeptidase P family protein [uncultured Sunxiuqinia sp.]